MSRQIERSALVRHSAEEMFRLVSDVERYPEFLPWCGGAVLHEHDSDQLVASLDVQRGGLKQRFTTRNHLVPAQSIHMELVDGPFEYLKGVWEFRALRADACRVTLSLEFAVESGIARMAFAGIFAQAANTMVDAFCERARSLYEDAG
ncbi:type II toxin-antitoxin system RatA family toxin [Salicola sp. Rm-C-2C1-2]|uniref:type II toxin-antitoxin system RatA family toxin n=1 Tax=Salicola sp. Rm-C-2C1-2 TaxID=3141321 RepID=UPI0032E4F48F